MNLFLIIDPDLFLKEKNLLMIPMYDFKNILRSAIQHGRNGYEKRFVIKSAKGIHLLNVFDISLIVASGDFCVMTDSSSKTHPLLEKIRF